MDWLLYVAFGIMSVAVLGLFVSIGMQARNDTVFNYRWKVISQMHRAIERDQRAGIKEYHWRCRIYDSVTYDDMMRKWWKPVDSFYTDKSFMQ